MQTESVTVNGNYQSEIRLMPPSIEDLDLECAAIAAQISVLEDDMKVLKPQFDENHKAMLVLTKKAVAFSEQMNEKVELMNVKRKELSEKEKELFAARSVLNSEVMPT